MAKERICTPTAIATRAGGSKESKRELGPTSSKSRSLGCAFQLFQFPSSISSSLLFVHPFFSDRLNFLSLAVCFFSVFLFLCLSVWLSLSSLSPVLL